MLLTAGERISMALVAMAIAQLGLGNTNHRSTGLGQPAIEAPSTRRN